MAGITLKNVKKTYPGDVVAVQDFCLEIDDTEFVVLVGPSGCGKSTVLRMIAGLEEITGGDLFIGERKVNNVPTKKRDIAMVFQNYALYPHMTVYKNMAFSLKLRNTSKAEIRDRVLDAARILNIEHLLRRKPKALSGGERQRAALGRAMVRNPAAFLLDEPLSNLDAKLRTTMRMELIKLHRQIGATFVYVTHDQTEAMTMGDRIVIMKDGRIQQVDVPQKLYDEPRNTFVAGFIGSPQMNFLDVELTEGDGRFYILCGNDRIRIGSGNIIGNAVHYAGKQVIAGIRPEDIHIDDAFVDNNPESVISATVDVCEQMGNEIYLYLDYGATKLTARVPPGRIYEPAEIVKLGLDTAKLHLFDPETEEAIEMPKTPSEL